MAFLENTYVGGNRMLKIKKRLGIASFALATTLVCSPTIQAEEQDALVLEEKENAIIEEVENVYEGDPSKEESTKLVYADVSLDHYAVKAIHYLTDLNFISGTEDGLFNPDKPLTRAQAAKILTEALDVQATTNYRLKATDVPSTHWAYEYFKALEQQGIMSGNKGKLMPNAPVSRAQMATMLNRVYNYAAPTRFTSFTDIDRSFWAYYDINRLATNGITTRANQDFRPNEATTRAQFVLFVARSMDDRFKLQ